MCIGKLVRNGLTLICLLAAFETVSMAAITMQLQPSVPSPSKIGSVITWTASATDSNPGGLVYRFSAGPVGGNRQVVRDFSTSNTLDWTTIDAEGVYVIQVDVMNRLTGDITYGSTAYEMLPLATQNPVITPTANPLVFIYSAPPCGDGATMQVAFTKADGTMPAQNTPARTCSSTSTTNFYLAGMEANSAYAVKHVITQSNQSNAGPDMQLTTGSVPDGIAQLAAANQKVLQQSSVPEADWMLIQGPVGASPFATDLSGNVIWYYPQPITLTRADKGGRFLGINNTGSDSFGSVLRLFDVAGNTVQETTAGAVNVQLVNLGQRQIGVFHDEARRLPNGNIAVLATVEQMIAEVQGPGMVDVIGDMVVILDSNLHVVWSWDTFNNLDLSRTAVLGETCQSSGGCAAHFRAPDANDWTHANAIQETPDGNLLVSLQNQDWLIKIDYEDGSGSGRVLWRLGNGGDFIMQSDDAKPWFSHQHDSNFLADNFTLELFDNGNARKAADPNAHSRGQVLFVDQTSRTAQLILDQDLGFYSAGVGSAQRLMNGNYHFEAGGSGTSAISFELTNTGQTQLAIQAGAPEYRTFRVSSLYSGLN